MFKSKTTHNIAILTGVAAFYSQQTSQDILSVCFLVITALLVIFDLYEKINVKELYIKDLESGQANDETWRRIDEVETKIDMKD